MADTTSKTNGTRKYIRRKSKRSPLLLTLGTFIVLAAGILTLLWQVGQQENGRADAGDVVGPPTLTAAAVNQIFARVGSPMAGTGTVVEQASRNTNIDDAFALAVWWTETNDGAAGVGSADLNPGSVRGASGYPAAFDGYTIYPSYATAINDWFTLLRTRYVNRGLTSAYSICYSYVGTAGAAAWANKVVNLMLRYHGQSSISAAPTTPILAPAAPVMPAAPPPARFVEHKNVPAGQAGANNSQKHNTGRELVTARQPHKPVLVGQEQHGAQSSGQATQKAQRTDPVATQHNATGIFTTHVQQVLIILALLAALLVILPGIRIKWGNRKQAPLPADERITGNLENTGFQPLYFNEYSPLVPGALKFTGETGETGVQGEFRETGSLARDDAPEMIPPTPIFDSVSTVPLTPFIASRRSGEQALRRARLVPAGSTSVREDTQAIQAIQTMQTRERATEVMGALPRKPGETGYAGQKEQVIRKSQVKNS
ncbi:MAG: hypothetical protein NVS2B12_32980 [Ktedonobacteraceae bacterium]